MKPKNPAAVALGKLAGAVRTAAKAEASRINGRKGGRPKGGKNKPKEFGPLPPSNVPENWRYVKTNNLGRFTDAIGDNVPPGEIPALDDSLFPAVVVGCWPGYASVIFKLILQNSMMALACFDPGNDLLVEPVHY